MRRARTWAAAWPMGNREFWDWQAPDYSELYTSPWWQLEDDRIRSWLPRLPWPRWQAKQLPTVLDIGCGTGFLYQQLEASGIEPDYVGMDISPKMLDNFKPAGGKRVELVLADIADYEWNRSHPPDLIASIYCPLSFSESRWSDIGRLAASQEPGGMLFLMVLNRYSLRRLLRLQFGPRGRYTPRQQGTCEAGPAINVEVFYDRPREVRTAVTDLGYRVLHLEGDGPLSGVLERLTFWRANAWLGRRNPLLSYSIILIAEKT